LARLLKSRRAVDILIWRDPLTQRGRIGHGAAIALLEHGAHVTIVSSSESRVFSVVEEAKKTYPNVDGRVANVRNEEEYIELLKSLAPIDHLIFSSVDVIIRGPIAEADLENAKFLFGVKFWGAVTTGKAIAAHDIITPGGSLTLTSGGAAIRPGKTASIGGSLNAALFTLTKGLAGELADKRIRVNCVVPGLVKTALWDKMGSSKEKQEEMFKRSAEQLPTGFVAGEEDIAEAYLYAVRADYSTGSIITIGTCMSLPPSRADALRYMLTRFCQTEAALFRVPLAMIVWVMTILYMQVCGKRQ
jgi:NAD(P)-dependent dehydrogenase (short-subunit alcohol dehydrogenase family)